MLSRVVWMIVLGIVAGRASGTLYDSYHGYPLSAETERELRQLNILKWCALDVPDCNPTETRRVDGTCNNLFRPTRGGPYGPYRRLLPPEFTGRDGFRLSKSGKPLPDVRKTRIQVLSDGRVADSQFTHFMTHLMVAYAGEVTSIIPDVLNYAVATTTCCTPEGDKNPMCMPIHVNKDDLYLRTSNVRCLNMTRSITYQMIGCKLTYPVPERINIAPPMLDLNFVYGNNREGLKQFLEGKGGRFITEREGSRIWPPNGLPACVTNRKPLETRCHRAPIPGINSLLGGDLTYLWLFRNHNHIARQLEALNPCWSDEKLFDVARNINIALWQHVSYYEVLPSLIGVENLRDDDVIFSTEGYVDDYDENLDPTASLEFVYGLRWFHNMQEGRVHLYDKRGKILRTESIVDLTFRTGILPVNNTLEGITQGAFRQAAAASDQLIDPEMAERVLGPLQYVSDVVSSDIIKGRDMGLQSYTAYRRLCGLAPVRDFEDLRGVMNDEQVDALELLYEDVDDIDLMVGIHAERRVPGAVMGPTLACIIVEQFVRWRQADRFFYENSQHPGKFNLEQLREIRKMTLARLMCDNGDDVDAIQPFPLFLPKRGNRIVQCSNHPAPRLEVWRDPTCEHI